MKPNQRVRSKKITQHQKMIKELLINEEKRLQKLEEIDDEFEI